MKNFLRNIIRPKAAAAGRFPFRCWQWYRARWKRVTLLSFITVFFLVFICNRWVRERAEGKTFSDLNKVPFRETGLLLGTSRLLDNGSINPYFSYRVEAAAELYLAGKVRKIIVSGDNHVKGYDETTDMRNALVLLGVPDSCIISDFAGFRTLDSMLRCRDVFGRHSVTVISQQFHNERALFIASSCGMDAVAYNARDVDKSFGWTTRLREYLARVAAVMDVYVLHTGPKFRS